MSRDEPDPDCPQCGGEGIVRVGGLGIECPRCMSEGHGSTMEGP